MSRRPAEPASYAALSFVTREAGDKPGARKEALKALELTSSSDAMSVFIVANALYAAEEWDAVADLLAPITAPTQDSDLLRWRLGSLIFSDTQRCGGFAGRFSARGQDAALFSSLRRDVYAGGTAPGTEKLRRRYLRLHPGDLYIRLKWLESGPPNDQVRAMPATRFSSAAWQSMTMPILHSPMELARVLDRHHRSEKAFAIAYAILRQHWQNPEAHISYTCLFFEGHGTARITQGIDSHRIGRCFYGSSRRVGQAAYRLRHRAAISSHQSSVRRTRSR